MFFRLYLLAVPSLLLLIQPGIYAPGTDYGWVGQGSVEYEVCLTHLHMASTGNRSQDLLILSPTLYPNGPHAPTNSHSWNAPSAHTKYTLTKAIVCENIRFVYVNYIHTIPIVTGSSAVKDYMLAYMCGGRSRRMK